MRINDGAHLETLEDSNVTNTMSNTLNLALVHL